MSRKQYTWRPDVPDHRDHYFTAKPKVTVDHVDPLGQTNPIEDQGQLGSCTGNSTTSAVEITLMKDMKLGSLALSRLFAYYNGRVVEGTVRQDAGAMIRDVVKGVFKVGVSSEKLWPYVVSKFARKPVKAAFTEAGSIAVTLQEGYEYARVTDLKSLKAALIAGNPVVFGFTVPESFENLPRSGVLSFPSPSEASLGGHAVVAVGFDDRASTPFVWVRNSWGPDWGLKGYFKMPYRWFTDPARLVDDMWLIRKKS